MTDFHGLSVLARGAIRALHWRALLLWWASLSLVALVAALPLFYVAVKSWESGWHAAWQLLWRPFVFGLLANTLKLMVLVTAGCVLLGLALLAALASAQAQEVTSCPAGLEQTRLYAYTGNAPATFTVPARVTSVRLIAVGADGGERTPNPYQGGAGAQGGQVDLGLPKNFG